MKEKIKKLWNEYFWLIVLIGLLAIGAATYFLAGYVEEKTFDKTVSTQNKAANTAVRESVNATGAAANYAVERRAEDAVREKVISPKLNDARRRSNQSKQDLVIAQKQYETRRKNPSNLNSSVADNCSELQHLFPDKKFEYCQ